MPDRNRLEASEGGNLILGYPYCDSEAKRLSFLDILRGTKTEALFYAAGVLSGIRLCGLS